MRTFNLKSRQRCELIDITEQIRDTVAESGVRSGIALVYTPHTTAAITINENADPDVTTDLLAGLDRIAPLHNDYRHAEGNSAAHIKSSLVGAAVSLIIEAGEPVLGTWQGVFFCEFDGPRSRKVHVRIMAA